MTGGLSWKAAPRWAPRGGNLTPPCPQPSRSALPWPRNNTASQTRTETHETVSQNAASLSEKTPLTLCKQQTTSTGAITLHATLPINPKGPASCRETGGTNAFSFLSLQVFLVGVRVRSECGHACVEVKGQSPQSVLAAHFARARVFCLLLWTSG